MEPIVASLIVASAFLHALWSAALKLQADREAATVAILVVAIAIPAAALWAGSGSAFPVTAGLAWSLAAGLCEGGYFVTLVLGLRDAPLGVVYAISRGGAVAAIWPVSAIWLGEAITTRSVAGAVVLSAGLVLVGLERSGRTSTRGVLWAGLCALFIAAYHLCYKCALATGAAPSAVFTSSLAVALPVNFARMGKGALARTLAAARARPLPILVAGVLCTGSFLLFLLALSRGGAGAAATLRNTSVVFALLLAWLIGERPGRAQIIGTLGVASGAVLLGWPG
jgi:drug/metabolite transporter (DMT)-like permease